MSAVSPRSLAVMPPPPSPPDSAAAARRCCISVSTSSISLSTSLTLVTAEPLSNSSTARPTNKARRTRLVLDRRPTASTPAYLMRHEQVMRHEPSSSPWPPPTPIIPDRLPASRPGPPGSPVFLCPACSSCFPEDDGAGVLLELLTGDEEKPLSLDRHTSLATHRYSSIASAWFRHRHHRLDSITLLFHRFSDR